MLQDVHNKRQLELQINSSGCVNVNTTPTTFTGESPTLLDLFLTSFDLTYAKAGIVSRDIIGHLGVFFVYKNEIHKIMTIQMRVSIQDITETSLRDFSLKLFEFDWKKFF